MKNAARVAELFRRQARLHGELARLEVEIADELDPAAAPAPKAPPRPIFVVREPSSDEDREAAKRRLQRRGYAVRDKRANR